MPNPNPKDEIVDPARIKALLPKKPEEMGLGSLGAWTDWLNRQRPVKARFIGVPDNSRSGHKK